MSLNKTRKRKPGLVVKKLYLLANSRDYEKGQWGRTRKRNADIGVYIRFDKRCKAFVAKFKKPIYKSKDLIFSVIAVEDEYNSTPQPNTQKVFLLRKEPLEWGIDDVDEKN